ncbi:AraC family transcriptional regulator [Nocardia arizonensis]|uniref:AraC family transcriptional regulator n=1 Tax=Nocardia arizonensis TaxID=1141647 RepID=UPI000A670F29|nr:AraC family transcriptional regulator [Nocardia arizonensis]
MAEYRREDFSTDVADPTGSWDWYLSSRQGPVGLTFPDNAFRSEASAQNVGRLQLVRFTSAALEYRRSTSHIRRGDGENSYRLLVPLHGSFRFEQGDSRELLHPGRISFFHWGRPLYMTHDQDITALILTVPEGMVDPVRAANAPLVMDETRPLVGGLAAQVRWLDAAVGWTAADFSVAYASVLTQLDGALNPYPAITSGPRAREVERARALIEECAHDRTVTPADIAAMVGLAERTLYRALKEAGYPAVGVMLRTVRLERAHRRLRSALPVDIAEIARQEGFPSLRRFREAYRDHYGRTPAETREQLFGDTAEK